MPSFRRVVQALGEAWEHRARPGARAGRRARRRRAQGAAPGRDACTSGRCRAAGDARRRRRCGSASFAGAPVEPASTPTPLIEQRRRRASPPASTPSGAASGPRPKFPRPPWSSCACASPPWRHGDAERAASHGTAARSTPWRPAASTTTSSAGSAATRPTRAGWCPTSRRCSPTRRCWPGPTSTRGRTTGTRRLPRRRAPRRSTSSCATCRRPRARSTPPSTPTPAASKGGHATFTLDELAPAPPAALVAPAAEWYGITDGGNWEGRSIPVRPVGAPLARPPEIEEARRLLAAARARRVQPARDEKVLTEWNAMAAATLAEVGVGHRRREHYGRRAEEIGEFLWRVHVRRRPADAQLAGRAGPAPRRGGRPRLAGRGLRPPVGVDRATRCWRERARRGRRRAARPVLGRRVGRVLHHRPRRRGARRAAQGVPRRRASPPPTPSRSRRCCGSTRSGRRPAARRRRRAHASRWPRRCSSGTPARWPTWWRRCRCGAGANEIVVTGDRPDLLAEVRRHWLPGGRRGLGRAGRRPALRRTARRAGPGLRLPRRARARPRRRTSLPWPANWRRSSR